MTTEDGLNVGKAFEAVRQCHQDMGRLICELDGRMQSSGWQRDGIDRVAYPVSLLASAGCWMPFGVFRHYRQESDRNLIEGFNALFFWGKGELPEPRLVVGRARYVDWDQDAHEGKHWDFDTAYWKACERGIESGTVSAIRMDDSRIDRICVVGTDLYGIRSLEDVLGMLGTVREKFVANDA